MRKGSVISKRMDLTGQRYGKLTVLDYSHTHKKVAWWRCACDCGKEWVGPGANLRSGNTSSCGCVWHKAITGEGSHLYTGGLLKAEYRRQVRFAKYRKLAFELTESQVTDLFSGNCFYCRTAPQPDNRGLVRNGIDRMDNDVGYTVDNVVSCCGVCNILKGKLNADQFISKVNEISSNFV